MHFGCTAFGFLLLRLNSGGLALEAVLYKSHGLVVDGGESVQRRQNHNVKRKKSISKNKRRHRRLSLKEVLLLLPVCIYFGCVNLFKIMKNFWGDTRPLRRKIFHCSHCKLKGKMDCFTYCKYCN